MTQVWLVTGSARGLGRFIVENALGAGHHVLATARRPAALEDLLARYPQTLRTFALDVTDATAAQAAADAAIAQFGRIDVLVNNAGYGHAAPFEQASVADFRAQIDTNFHGVVNLARAVLPTMRTQRSGHIINVSSVGGRIGTPGLSAYQAAKWAVGGFSEALALETAPFGVKVIALEPGGMRTDWAGIARGNMPALLPDYQPSVGAFAQMLAAHDGNQAGDPAKVAQVVLALAAHADLPPHLLLGSDALSYFGRIDGARQRAAEAWRDVSRSTDLEHAGPIPALPTAADWS